MQPEATNPFATPLPGKGAVIRETWIEEPGRICVLTFDKPGSSANTLDRTTLEELERRLEQIEASRDVRGVVFTSAKEAVFIAGADFELLKKGPENRSLLAEYLELGQRVFNRIASLKIPTVAAIHGACLGGGYELALACDYRIATDDKRTKIGLPETKLGIIPAWGGSTRLPRLVGLPRAMKLILTGKTPHAEAAVRYGMVDRVVPREWLLPAALQAVEQRKRTHVPAWRGWANRITATATGGNVRAATLRRTRGHYPAPVAALDVMVAGAGADDPAPSLAREREAVERLAGDPECRNLFHVFQLQEETRRRAKAAAKEVPPVRRAAVIGAGVMGAGIAQWLSSRGISVILRDIDAARLGAGMARIAALYQEAVKRHLMTAKEARDGLDRIFPAAYEPPLALEEWVIEAAVEKLEIKERLFENLGVATQPGTILATNTSALPVGQIAAHTANPGRVIGLHFFNPVHRMPLVEVVLPDQADADSRRRALAFANQIGKTPLVVRDVPGFLVNRVLLPYLMQAAMAFESGADVEAIDRTMLDFGMPMGPLRLADEVGLDVALEVARTLAAAYPDRMSVPAFFPKMVEAGLLGRKSGRGFYEYPASGSGNGAVFANRDALGLRPGGTRLDAESLRNRMIYRMLDEAVRCLDERVVGTPGDADLGMVLGAGFPPFRGGPLRYIDAMGADAIVSGMDALRLGPCMRLREMAARNLKFYEDSTNQTGGHAGAPSGTA